MNTSKIDRELFIENAQRARRIIESWPKWKQDAMAQVMGRRYT